MMFINAEPRYVSNSFETFVPFHRVDTRHQRLIEMTNNDVNAWSVFRPAGTSTLDSWDRNLDEYGNENFQVQSLYGGYFQDMPPASQNQAGAQPRTVTYAPAFQVQCQSFKNVSTSQQAYQEPEPEMNCFERPSPMLANDYSDLSLGRGRGSFAEFSSIRNVLKNSTSQPNAETGNLDIDSTASGAPQPSYAASHLPSSTMSVADTNWNTLQSSYSPTKSYVDHEALRATDTQSSNISSNKSQSWHGNLHSRSDQTAYGFPSSHDSLAGHNQQQYCDLWATNTSSAADWSSHTLAYNTISPKMLTLNVSDTSLSSCASSQGSMMAMSETSNAITENDDGEAFSDPEQPKIERPQQQIRRPRQILPDTIPASRRIVPMVPSNDFTSDKNSKKRSMKVSKPTNHSRRRSITPRSMSPTGHPVAPKPKTNFANRLTTPKKIQPKPVDPTTCTQSATLSQAMHQRDAKDDFLIRSKLAGMSYKDIRQQGGFTEAESTLRGRFRTLTKHKTARVRKPEWEEKDINLLKRAVRKLSQGSDPSKLKIPWKQVAEYIANHGGSYHFGNATCRKRWDELQGKS